MHSVISNSAYHSFLNDYIGQCVEVGYHVNSLSLVLPSERALSLEDIVRNEDNTLQLEYGSGHIPVALDTELHDDSFKVILQIDL